MLSWWLNCAYGELGPGDGDQRGTGPASTGYGVLGEVWGWWGTALRGAWPGGRGSQAGTRPPRQTGWGGRVGGGGPRVRRAWPTGDGVNSGTGTRLHGGAGPRGSVGWWGDCAYGELGQGTGINGGRGPGSTGTGRGECGLGDRAYGELGPRGDGDQRWTGTRLHGVRGLRGTCGLVGTARTGSLAHGGTAITGRGPGPQLGAGYGEVSVGGNCAYFGAGLPGDGDHGGNGDHGERGPRWDGSSRGEWGSAGVGSHGNSWRGSGSACRVGPQTLSRGVAMEAS